MAKEPTDDPTPSTTTTPTKTADFPIPADQVERHIADAGALADRDFDRFGWNADAPVKPKRQRRKKVEKPSK